MRKKHFFSFIVISLIGLCSINLKAEDTNAAFIEKNGIIVIEAESTPLVAPWVKETSHANYSGASYLRFNGNNTSGGNPNGRLIYKLKITTAGRYKMDIRCSRPIIDPSRTDLANDCYTKMVGHSGYQGTDCKTYKPGAATADTWHWDKFIHYTAAHQHKYPEYNLTAGIHLFEVSGRAKEFKIDRIMFWHTTAGSKATAQNLNTAESEREGDDESATNVSGELKQWHKVSLTFDGPETSETASTNPFLDYRLNVTFTQGSLSYVVPGYYCADGNAANTTTSIGNKWRVNFAPPTTGQWNYTVSFRSGANVAVSTEAFAGTATGFDGESGNFTVAATDKAGDDLRGKGLLKLAAGKPYLQFAGNGKYWIKGGTDSPEDLLGCSDFDNTTKNGSFGLTNYPDHVQDWATGDPTWNNGKGKGIIGVFNYLNSQKVNSAYFLPMNLGGDGNNTHPFASMTNDLVYDCSKLDQWGIVLDHAQKKGVVLQIVLNEAEAGNKNRLDNGTLGTERKLFYRELIARFGHVNGVKWNICEEFNGGGAWSADQVKSFAAFIRSTDPYNHPIGIHNYQGYPIKYNVQDVFDTFAGNNNFDFLSIQYRPAQYSTTTSYAEVIPHLRNDGSSAGRPLALMFDELERATTADDESHDTSNRTVSASGAKFLRKAVLWQSYLSGAGGVEWILSDLLNAHNFRRYQALWGYTRHARSFVEELPLGDMVPSHSLLTGESK